MSHSQKSTKTILPFELQSLFARTSMSGEQTIIRGNNALIILSVYVFKGIHIHYLTIKVMHLTIATNFEPTRYFLNVLFKVCNSSLQ